MLVTTDAVKRYDPHMQRMACFAFLLSRIDLGAPLHSRLAHGARYETLPRHDRRQQDPDSISLAGLIHSMLATRMHPKEKQSAHAGRFRSDAGAAFEIGPKGCTNLSMTGFFNLTTIVIRCQVSDIEIPEIPGNCALVYSGDRVFRGHHTQRLTIQHGCHDQPSVGVRLVK